MFTVKISQQKKSNLSQEPTGLVNGPYGAWAMEYYNLVDQLPLYKSISQKITPNEMINAYNTASHYSYCFGYGLTGLLWSINCFVKGSKEVAQIIDRKTLIPILEAEAIRLIGAKKYDLFNGVNGIMVYLLITKSLSLDVYKSYISSLNVNLAKGELIPPSSSLVKNNKKLRGINLGIPHGIAGCILMLVRLFEYESHRECLELLEDSITYLLGKGRRTANMTGCFSYYDNPESEIPPLAWCYSDLSTGYAILKSGKSLQKSEYTETGIYILDNTLERNDYVKEDLSMCHGTPCIAYLYRKAWLLTGLKRYNDRSEYWANSTRLLLNKQMKDVNSSIEFRKNYLENESLIYGYPGTQLALQTMDGNISAEWDSWMLL